ncbi:unnamed protein product [Sphenostylis stenocarpa]|uniref:Albumin I chain a domain-containing protein n=1 Tax=Sphenostylis stenocarpa TaxID=92480 RepID=A0AA86W487_9FABA|nr:unnamed protein product [Sphenostylis stenocarpa]CAJ1978332.1 unnamed protein product [Sphenostylis stenocarpa]
MAFVRLAALFALFFLATFVLSMKSTEAASCSGTCTVGLSKPCGSTSCICSPVLLLAGICSSGVESLEKKIDEHPNLCRSDDDCVKKGSGDYCAPYPYQHVHYGWCFDSNSRMLKNFLALPKGMAK